MSSGKVQLFFHLMKKNELQLALCIITKLKDHRIKHKTVQLKEENLCGLEISKDFLERTSKARSWRKMTDKSGYMKLEASALQHECWGPWIPTCKTDIRPLSCKIHKN